MWGLTSIGFEENKVDQCIYLRGSWSKFIIYVLYVDDILLAKNNLWLLHGTKQLLFGTFNMGLVP